MLHTYPFGHSHAFRSEALKCKNEPYQGRTYGTTWVDSYLLLLRQARQSVRTVRWTERTRLPHSPNNEISIQASLTRKSRDHYSCAELTSNRHAIVLSEGHANSLTYSFGLRGEDHGVAVGLSNDSIDAANTGSSSSSSPILSSFFSVA